MCAYKNLSHVCVCIETPEKSPVYVLYSLSKAIIIIISMIIVVFFSSIELWSFWKWMQGKKIYQIPRFSFEIDEIREMQFVVKHLRKIVGHDFCFFRFCFVTIMLSHNSLLFRSTIMVNSVIYLKARKKAMKSVFQGKFINFNFFSHQNFSHLWS